MLDHKSMCRMLASVYAELQIFVYLCVCVCVCVRVRVCVTYAVYIAPVRLVHKFKLYYDHLRRACIVVHCLLIHCLIRTSVR